MSTARLPCGLGESGRALCHTSIRERPVLALADPFRRALTPSWRGGTAPPSPIP